MSQATKWPARRVRETFINFFVERCSHTFVKSSPVVPHDDPTLLFANAGMNQFKPIFLGQVDPRSPLASLKRAVNTQKCIRAGGKHNDLDDVGKDTYHHTFFEMLGNWSFGDYFKREAIDWAWKLLTEVYMLNSDRLYVTYFGGDVAQGLEPDLEARDLWLKYLPKERVLPFGCKDNFWEMGEVGPCGPCSEIHYDRIGNRDAASLVNADVPDVIEIWNNVFIQFNREPDGSLRRLPSKSQFFVWCTSNLSFWSFHFGHIRDCTSISALRLSRRLVQHVDTGMGFERLTSILQNKSSNYDTDVFLPLFEAIQKITGAEPYTGKVGTEDVNGKDMAYRVVADHVRTLTFAITDGAVPSNEGRGYVLRRILRRGVRYGEQVLGAKNGFISELVPVLVDHMKEAFPELQPKMAHVREVILDEERAFGRTLSKGLERFKRTADALQVEGKTVIPGEDAFFLYDSMGFPLDLTQIMAEERGMTVDVAGYQQKMQEQKIASKKKADTGAVQLVLEAQETSELQSKGIQPTDDSLKYIWHKPAEATLKAIFTPDGFVEASKGYEKYLGLIFDKTSFYAEEGGQIYDTGAISSSSGLNFKVHEVQKYGGYVLHLGKATGGSTKVGETLTLEVDYHRRANVAPNHTMTHVLNYALRTVLGNSVEQKGSLVTDDRLRFDFNWNGPVKTDQLSKIEEIVREQIRKALPVYHFVAPLEKASKISALRKVFGDTYPDPVRIISVGTPVEELLSNPENAEWVQYSIEFCGGTHLTNTSQAVAFGIVEETGIAKGVRRITAVTNEAALACEAKAKELQAKLEDVSKCEGPLLVEAVAKVTPMVEEAVISVTKKDSLRKVLAGLVDRVKKYKKEASKQAQEQGVKNAAAAAKTAAEQKKDFVVVQVDVGTDAGLGRKMLEAMQSAHPGASFLIVSTDTEKGKTAAFAQVSDRHNEGGLDARQWVNAALSCLGGKGGGKDPLNAAGQAKSTENVDAAVEAAKKFVAGST